MKINSIQQQNTQSFSGRPSTKAADYIAGHPDFILKLAGISAIGQKLVMSAAEGTLGPAFDVGTGHLLKKLAHEEDDRTIQSSNAQAIRTFSQVVGGTLTGIAVRAVMIYGTIAVFSKIGKTAGGAVASLINNNKTANSFEISYKASEYGKNIGGLLATITMFATNFLLDIPIINKINSVITSKIIKKDNPIEQTKEAE